jgi:hypothetical protein
MSSMYVELAKLGAIGVSVICLILAFRSNSQVSKLAGSLTPERFRGLTAHARWTLSFATVFLLIALVSEILTRQQSATDLGLELVPNDLDSATKQLKILQPVLEPVRVKLAGAPDPIQFRSGTARISVQAGSTLSVDVHEMIVAMSTAEAIAAGEQELRLGNGGKTEPQQ